MVIGYWLLVIGYWLLVVGCWLLVIGYGEGAERKFFNSWQTTNNKQPTTILSFFSTRYSQTYLLG
ncbi:hypothetical protein NJ959_22145 [Symplocastrum sp. BBK-W-15]|uniref:Uncharacterized protein n=1 Tax=Limnofasciculus baicalensis BBK-W-15 TaxID=2699891 RepID=A0AAE3KU50_9CYAN|nr:hypothetical protein [Limnofasciculus baicalensis]MCP2731132.1 hypothetical protein [Limnofasciculus baicalensis BBK-W-15]